MRAALERRGATTIARLVVSTRANVVSRSWTVAGDAGQRLAHACCLLLLLTLAWGPHWPFSRAGLVAPPAGLLNAAFDLADLLLVGILAGWGIALVTGRDHVQMRPLWIGGLLLLFSVASALAMVHAQDHAAAQRFAVRSAGLTALYLYLRRGIEAGRLTPAMVAVWLVPGMSLNGLLAIAQAMHNDPLGLRWLGEPQMLRTTLGTAVIQVHDQPLLRAYGVMPHPNVLGGLLAAAVPLVAGRIMGAASKPPVRWRTRGGVARDILLLLCLALMAAGLVLSFSRSAWLGLLCGVIYLLMCRAGAVRRPARRTMLIGAGIGLVVTALLAIDWDAVSVRLWPPGNRLEWFSVQQRLSLLRTSFEVIARHPLMGVGGNNYALAAAPFLARGANAQLPVHSTYLLAQAELGPLGSVAWLVLMGLPALELARRMGRRRAGFPSPSVSATSAGPLARKQGTGMEGSDTVSGAGAATTLRRGTWMLDPGACAPSMAATGEPRGVSSAERWHALAGCSLVVTAVVGLLDFYVWVNEPVAVLWIVALAVFAATAPDRP
jgi:O-antigen ligase